MVGQVLPQIIFINLVGLGIFSRICILVYLRFCGGLNALHQLGKFLETVHLDQDVLASNIKILRTIQTWTMTKQKELYLIFAAMLMVSGLVSMSLRVTPSLS